MDCVSPVQCGCSMGSRYHPAGEAFWAGEHCKKFCHREASTHTIHRSPSSCGPGQRFGTLRGIFGCHPLSPGIYQATMHSHVTSFDQKTVEFPGTCASVFTKSCGSSSSLPHFNWGRRTSPAGPLYPGLSAGEIVVGGTVEISPLWS
uniref:Uncharacterized protein n=1 Tax=Piliocolobus tephrosceles TaxID=591936 RepID=A0A8C9LQ54_9PRIM